MERSIKVGVALQPLAGHGRMLTRHMLRVYAQAAVVSRVLGLCAWARPALCSLSVLSMAASSELTPPMLCAWRVRATLRCADEADPDMVR